MSSVHYIVMASYKDDLSVLFILWKFRLIDIHLTRFLQTSHTRIKNNEKLQTLCLIMLGFENVQYLYSIIFYCVPASPEKSHDLMWSRKATVMDRRKFEAYSHLVWTVLLVKLHALELYIKASGRN